VHNINFPCLRCTHIGEKHIGVILHNGSKAYLCLTCKEHEYGMYAGFCDYKPDNLKYLEQLSE
jgi:hypothetical protein